MNGDLTVGTILSEIDTIESEIGTPAYWKDDAKQARYRHLLERKAELTASTPSVIDADLLPIASPAEFRAEMQARGVDGASYSEYLAINRHAADVLMSIPPQDQAGFTAAFEALPDEVAAAALAELVDRKPPVEWSSEEAVYAFSQLPEGALLTREWRHDARKNLALVRERLFRVIDRLEDDSEVDHFMSWLDGLSTPAAVAVYRKLAA